MTTDAQRTPTDDLIHTMLRALVQSSHTQTELTLGRVMRGPASGRKQSLQP